MSFLEKITGKKPTKRKKIRRKVNFFFQELKNLIFSWFFVWYMSVIMFFYVAMIFSGYYIDLWFLFSVVTVCNAVMFLAIWFASFIMEK